MKDMRLLAEFDDYDGDVLRLYEADEDTDYLVLVQEETSIFDGSVSIASVAFHKDELPEIVKVITDFMNS